MYSLNYTDRGTPAATAAEQVSLEIDGQPVSVPAGTSIMRAASLGGVQVPKLCATDTLKAFGSWSRLMGARATRLRAPQKWPPA
jgi:formate dehydrogenase major subunit